MCELAGANSARGGGVRVTRFMQAANVDYKRVPELTGVDLNAYRGKPSLRYRVGNES